MSATFRLRIPPTETFRRRITWHAAGVPVDLTGYSAVFSVRDFHGAAVMTLTGGDGITLGSAAGTIDLHATAVQVQALAGSGTYHLHVVDSLGDVHALLCGEADFRPCTFGSDDADLVIDSRDNLVILTAGRQGPAGPDIDPDLSLIYAIAKL